jgi:amino acid adenylation domain-containing protein
MLEDARAAVLVTHSALVGRIDGPAVERVLMDESAEIDRQPRTAPPHGAHPDNLAYVIYTSGSTGKPKGVAIRHGGLNHYLTWARTAYAVNLGVGAPVNTPLAFDATITSLWTPLTVGRTVSLLPESHHELPALAQALTEGPGFSLVKLTPMHLSALQALQPEAACAAGSNALVIGGEALRWAQIMPWRMNAPQIRLINEYGPTEATVGCIVYEIPSRASADGPVPIGRPIPNTQAYVLDGDLGLVPTGVTGELYLSGDGLARGYFGRPDLTAQRFIANPYGPAGSRLYRSGDLARWRAEGELEFLGRIDQQVKIRGYRIELGEIEAALLERADMREAVVLAREDVPGEKQLVAYVVSGTSMSVDELRAHLGRSLPAYMVPAFFVQLESLPLTTNGKIDRNALPPPEGRVQRPGYVAPRTPIEQTLAEIWAEVLHVQRVGIHDNFFELGGHSLLAMQAMARTRDALQIDMSIRTLFETPSISQLGDYIVEQIAQHIHDLAFSPDQESRKTVVQH